MTADEILLTLHSKYTARWVPGSWNRLIRLVWPVIFKDVYSSLSWRAWRAWRFVLPKAREDFKKFALMGALCGYAVSALSG